MNRAFAAAALGLVLSAGATQAATVIPHQAVYDLALARGGSGSGLTAAEGRIAFEIQGSTCEGWTVSFRMATRYQPESGEASLIDTQTTSFEGPGGLEFRHQLKKIINGEPKDEHRIRISRDATAAESEGTIQGKEETTFTVPGGAVFPMQHQIALMALGEAGGGRDSSIVFDGSSEAKSYRAISFVGRAKPFGSIADDAANPEAAALKGLSAWPTTISYFPETGGEDMPDYQVSLNMYENGVATGVMLDYGRFALSGRLAKLELLEASPCP